MKKKYLSFGLVYCVIALLVFFAVMSFYTKKKTDEVNSYVRSFMYFPEMTKQFFTFEDCESLFYWTLDTWEWMSDRDENIGFYSSVVETGDEGRVLLETQDFIKVRYFGEFETEIIENSPDRYEDKQYQLVPGNSRYLLFDDPDLLTKDEAKDIESYENYYNVSITGARCDDVLVYGGTLTYTVDNDVKAYVIAKPDVVNEAVSVPYEECIVRLDDIECFFMGENSGNNKKAHKLSDEYVEMFLSNKASGEVTVKEGIFRTTGSSVYVFDKGNYLVTYYWILNPFQIVLRDNLKVYVLSFLALVLLEGIIIYVVRKLYLNQKSFELRSRKLTSGIAYDLKGPLAVTREYLDKWDNIDEDKRPEYSEKIISEVDHMSSMVTRLLELSKMQDGSVKLNCEDVDLLQLTQNILKRNRKAISDKKIEVTFGYNKEEDAYPVYADLEMIYIVINNFMTNAIKYCDHTIKIRLAKSGRRIEFGITNDGAMIEKTDLDKVWDVLYNSDNGRTEPSESGGVGLSVVKSILEAHKANYGCYSGYKGTNFWFSMDAYDDRSFS